MIGIPLGLLYANAGEWVLHKYVLHRLARRRGSFWKYHWEHHGLARKHGYVDPDYERSVFGWHAQGKEAFSLAAIAAAHLPLLPVAPLFTATVLYSAYDYYRVHKRGHLDPGWAREHLPWHVDHHMDKDPEANYCVTRPLFDKVMGTRKRWVGTSEEKWDDAAPPASSRAAVS